MNFRFLSISRLKVGRKSSARTIAVKRAIILKKTDSPRNCLINTPFPAPMIFLSPTSFALLAYRAVERVMKFIHANSKINKATAVKIYT